MNNNNISSDRESLAARVKAHQERVQEIFDNNVKKWDSESKNFIETFNDLTMGQKSATEEVEAYRKKFTDINAMERVNAEASYRASQEAFNAGIESKRAEAKRYYNQEIDNLLGINGEASYDNWIKNNFAEPVELSPSDKYDLEFGNKEKAKVETLVDRNKVIQEKLNSATELQRKQYEALSERAAYVEKELGTNFGLNSEAASMKSLKESAQGSAKFFSKHAGKLVGAAALGGMLFAMNSSRGEQSNAQLYGQAQAYQE